MTLNADEVETLGVVEAVLNAPSLSIGMYLVTIVGSLM